MQIFGREYGMLFTIGASQKIAKICPDGDLKRIEEVFTGFNENSIDAICTFISAMSEGYERRMHLEDPTHEISPISAEDLHLLTMEELQALLGEVFAKMGEDATTAIQTVPEKKAKAEQAE